MIWNFFLYLLYGLAFYTYFFEMDSNRCGHIQRKPGRRHRSAGRVFLPVQRHRHAPPERSENPGGNPPYHWEHQAVRSRPVPGIWQFRTDGSGMAAAHDFAQARWLENWARSRCIGLWLTACKLKQNRQVDLVLTALLHDADEQQEALDYLRAITELGRIPNVRCQARTEDKIFDPGTAPGFPPPCSA